MRTFTAAECRGWCAERGVELTDRGVPVRVPNGYWHSTYSLPSKTSELLWFCRLVEDYMQPRSKCLLWITAWGIWPSSENLHLYYRLRETYGDRRLLEDAPGHLFLEHERTDLVSYLQLGITFGWDMYVLATGTERRVSRTTSLQSSALQIR